jgi:hypothetical protein
MKFSKGKSGNPGGRPKVLGELQELARQFAPKVIAELARLALKGKSETARIAASRELLDRGFGKARQSMEVTAPPDDPIRMLLDDIDARNREHDRARSPLTGTTAGGERKVPYLGRLGCCEHEADRDAMKNVEPFDRYEAYGKKLEDGIALTELFD